MINNTQSQKHKKYVHVSWSILIIVSLLLFGMYFIASELHDALAITQFDSLLKGLSILQHFGIHFFVGIFFGFCDYVVWFGGGPFSPA